MTFSIRHIFRFLALPVLFTAMFSSCCKDESEKDTTVERTVLVYMAADNNLSGYCEPNMTRMRSTMTKQHNRMRLVVFVDKPGQNPLLLRLNERSVDTLRIFPEVNSTDAKVLSYVIKETVRQFPAKHYGLVMWSHGTGWIPAEALHFAASNLGYVPGRDGSHVISETVLEGRRWPYYDTKSFGFESVPITNAYGNSGYVSMDLKDMADAIPNGLFDYILFDACYMGNVEIAYELRRKAKQIVSSCYEIVADGFPYHQMTPDLLSGDMTSAADKFYRYYRDLDVSDSQRWQRMAGVSVVETDALDSLARCFKKIVSGKYEEIMTLPVKEIQHFDRFSRTVFYDLEDMVEHLCKDQALLNEFKAQLKRSISFSKSTDYIFLGDEYREIEVKKYCGLSVYIPRYEYDSNQIFTPDTRTNLNSEYLKTAWSYATGYGTED